MIKNRIGRAALLVATVGLAVSAPMAGTLAQAGAKHDKAILKNAAILKASPDKAILKAPGKAIL